MNKITFPLEQGMKGAAVTDLQEALQLLLDRCALLRDDEAARRVLSAALKSEQTEQTYGKTTGKLVSIFLEQRGLQASRAVDEPTADAINAVLEELGAFRPVAPDPQRLVGGQVRREDGLPFQSVRVRAFHESDRGAIRLGEDTTDAEGRYTIRYELLPGVDVINLRVTVFDAAGKLLHDSDVIRGAKLLEIVDLIVPGADIKPYRVEGKVFSRVSAGVGGLSVVIVDKGIGGDVQLAQATTDEGGAYQATFSNSDVRRGKVQPDLQARVFAGDAFLGASDVHYNASQHETLNVLLEDKVASALRSEHEVLTSALASQFTGKLSDLKETDEQQDITYLSNKTGWDARAVALAALADQFSANTADADGNAGIAPALFYALFRAGLKASEDTLYHTDAKTLEAVWKTSAEQGVIPKASAEQISNLIVQFQALSAQKLLTEPALVGASSLNQMLTASRLDKAQHKQFAELYAAHRTDMPKFWEAATNAFGENTAHRLQVDGKLSFLTINNAPLMQELHNKAGDNGLTDPLQLAQQGYHSAQKWTKLLAQNVPVPKEIPGDTPEAKRANYADYLAAQVRLSYPTASIAEMINSGHLILTDKGQKVPQQVPEQVVKFLTEHQGEFEIGVQPVEQYIAQNKLKVEKETVKQVKRLQRVYQITPSDQAMTGLMKREVDAACHVVRYDKETFVQSFAADLGGPDHAALTYDKSVQVHNAVLNIALSYLNARTAPAIGVHSPPSAIDPVPPANAGDVPAYATLESLFDSMDFCACDHCRSILSPAAYLVDLLLFLDQPNPPAGTENPQSVLLSRRPDIEYLPLTCENTNTALPYIDVVNETLEYFIAHDKQKLPLQDYKGHDTGGAASADLLASPQFVLDSVYTTTLGDERFPAPLPFHQPLEHLRRYFDKFGVPLPLAMERLRKSDILDVVRTTNPPPPLTDYGWRDILMEEIGLSRAEYEILTDSTAVPLWRMYGFPDGTTDPEVIAGLSNAKQFARRLGLSYEDLVSILKTRFINPNSDLIPKLERLGVDFAMLAELKKDDPATDAKFDALLAALAVAPDPAEYGGDIKAWVKDDDNYLRMMGLITLAIPANTWVAPKDYAIGDCVRPTVGQSGSTLYYECTISGKSAAEPNWPTVPGKTTDPDGTLVWICRDASSCLSFDNLAFRYSDPAKLTQYISAAEFVCLLRFIRLWKKLGWTIEQTDAAICALFPMPPFPLGADAKDAVENLDEGFLTLLPRLGIVGRVILALNLTPKRDLLPLLACWSEIGTHGDSALYRQMFLNPALLEQDAIFADNGYGEFLVTDTTTTEKVATHAEALRSAFNLSGDEYDRIVAALRYDANTALTIPNISAIYRRGWLARKLKLSVRELLLLTQLTGLDPFAAPNPTNPAILRLIELVQSMKDRSFKSEAALYLFWNQDLSGKSAPDPAQVTEFARTLRLSFAAIETEFSVQDDPDGTIAQARMALVYGVDTAAFFFGLLNDTFVTEVPYSRNQVPLVTNVACNRGQVTIVSYVSYKHHQASLEQSILNAAPGLVYDEANNRLSFTGALSAASVNALKAVSVTAIADSNARGLFETAVNSLYKENQRVINANLEQPIADTAPGLVYDEAFNRLSFTGALSAATVNALKAVSVTAIADSNVRGLFETAVNSLYEENQKVIKASLEQPIVDVASGRIAYDDFHKRLSYTSVLSAKTRDAIKNLASGVGAAAFEAAMEDLYTKNQAAIAPFFARYPELQSRYDAYINSSEPVTTKRRALLVQILPGLVKRRQEQQALQAASAAANTDLGLTQACLYAPAAPFSLHAVGDADQSALNDLLALKTPGLSVQFYANDKAPGAIIFGSPDIALNLDYSPAVGGVGNPLPANPSSGSAISGVWRGYLEAPESGFFKLRIEADADATVTLLLDDKPVGLTQIGTLWSNTDPLELRAGTLYPIELKVEKVRSVVRVQWEWEPKGQGRTNIPPRYLYPAVLFERFQETYVRFLKAASLATSLGLTANEMAYLATHSDYHINANGWLNALPVSGDPSATTAVALLKPFQALLDYARIKADLAPNDERLLTVFKDPVATKNSGLLYTITRWESSSLGRLLVWFDKINGGNADYDALKHLDTFVRAYDAFALIRKMAVSASALIDAATNEPRGDTVRDLQSALRALYDAADWRDVVQPINDAMRGLQRDALVAYILHQMRSNPVSAHIDTADKLFEYFLMDVQMEPCMQTSRIRHALSSVQLFIERCLMNLEPRVSPAAINPKQWEWMKRYRVWEANRKVYLFPENWLEPELRHDKSPFFKEIESELLQSDITEESATTALLNYLSKLEEVAKLEPCGIYHDEKKNIDHVVARTAGANRKYYYRSYDGGSWTPWEQVKLDIEDNPVIPVVWKGRLFLFWLRILKQTPLTTPNLKVEGVEPTSAASIKPSEVIKNNPVNVDVQAVLCWSEYYNGKWQSTKTSDIDRPTELGTFDLAGGFSFKRSKLKLAAVPTGNQLWIFIKDSGYSSFLLYNTHSLPVRKEDLRSQYAWDPVPRRILWTSDKRLFAGYWKESDEDFPSICYEVLTSEFDLGITDQQQAPQNAWKSPFFFADSRHVFYITTTEQPFRFKESSDYGLKSNQGYGNKVDIPPLIWESEPDRQIGPKLWGDGGPVGPDLSVNSPVPMQRFVTDDAYIHKGIGTTGSVMYGDRQIGPSGAIADDRAKTN